jgi:hypothetical protein
MRLIDVFVDICFLSFKVDPKAFFESAWPRNAFSSDMSGPFLSLGGAGRADNGALGLCFEFSREGAGVEQGLGGW